MFSSLDAAAGSGGGLFGGAGILMRAETGNEEKEKESLVIVE